MVMVACTECGRTAIRPFQYESGSEECKAVYDRGDSDRLLVTCRGLLSRKFSISIHNIRLVPEAHVQDAAMGDQRNVARNDHR